MSEEPIELIDVTARRPGLAPNVRGAIWMLGSALCFTAMMTLVKFLGDDYPAALQTFYRQVAGFVIMLPVILRRGRAAYATTRSVNASGSRPDRSVGQQGRPRAVMGRQ